MGLMNTFRKAVATLDAATKDVQATVYRRRYISEDRKGVKQLSDPEPIRCIVEPKNKRYYDHAGRIVEQQYKLTILEPLANPINALDVFIVNGVETPQIMTDGGIEDTGTLQNLLNMVTLGHIRSMTK